MSTMLLFFLLLAYIQVSWATRFSAHDCSFKFNATEIYGEAVLVSKTSRLYVYRDGILLQEDATIVGGETLTIEFQAPPLATALIEINTGDAKFIPYDEESSTQNIGCGGKRLTSSVEKVIAKIKIDDIQAGDEPLIFNVAFTRNSGPVYIGSSFQLAPEPVDAWVTAHYFTTSTCSWYSEVYSEGLSTVKCIPKSLGLGSSLFYRAPTANSAIITGTTCDSLKVIYFKNDECTTNDDNFGVLLIRELEISFSSLAAQCSDINSITQGPYSSFYPARSGPQSLQMKCTERHSGKEQEIPSPSDNSRVDLFYPLLSTSAGCKESTSFAFASSALDSCVPQADGKYARFIGNKLEGLYYGLIYNDGYADSSCSLMTYSTYTNENMCGYQSNTIMTKVIAVKAESTVQSRKITAPIVFKGQMYRSDYDSLRVDNPYVGEAIKKAYVETATQLLNKVKVETFPFAYPGEIKYVTCNEVLSPQMAPDQLVTYELILELHSDMVDHPTYSADSYTASLVNRTEYLTEKFKWVASTLNELLEEEGVGMLVDSMMVGDAILTDPLIAPTAAPTTLPESDSTPLYENMLYISGMALAFLLLIVALVLAAYYCLRAYKRGVSEQLLQGLNSGQTSSS